MRTGAMFFNGDDDHNDGRNIRITVFYDSFQHDLNVPTESTFGDVKRLLVPKTDLKLEDQALFFRGYERHNEEFLHLAGVTDKSQMYVLQDPSSQTRNLELSKRHLDMLKASEAVAGVRAEVDKLSERLAALEVAVYGETTVAQNEFVMLTELLMRQLLKLDTIEAEGEARLQRKAEVCRVQSLVDTLDSLKERNSNPLSKSNSNAFSVTSGENFDSGMGSLNAPASLSPSGKVTQSLEQFDCSDSGIEKIVDPNIGRVIPRKRMKHSEKPLGAQAPVDQRVENKTASPKDPQSSHQREAKERIDTGAIPGASELEDTMTLSQPKVHINERTTTKDAQAQTEVDIIKQVVIPALPKQIETGIIECLAKDDVRIGNNTNVFPQVVAQPEETTEECPTGGGVPTPTNQPAKVARKDFSPFSSAMHSRVPAPLDTPAEISHKNYFSSILAPIQAPKVPISTSPPAMIAHTGFISPILQPTQGTSSQEVEVASGEHHSLTSARPPIAGESSSAGSVHSCLTEEPQQICCPPLAFYRPPSLGQIIPAHSTSKYSSKEPTFQNVEDILRHISPSSSAPISLSPVDPLAAAEAPTNAARNVATSVARLCGLDDRETKQMEIAFNKYPNLMVIRSDRRKTFIRWMFCSLSNLLQLLSAASTGTLDMPMMNEIEVVLRELETFGFDPGFIYDMRLQVREARFAIDNASFDLKALCAKAEGLNLEIEFMETNIAAAKAEVKQVEAKINTLCDFVDNHGPLFKWIQ